MRKLLLLGVLSFCLESEAAVVCREKTTGRVIETQSAGTPGICLKNLVQDNPQYGLAPSDIEELLVDETMRQQLVKEWDANPLNPDVEKQKSQEKPIEIPAGTFGGVIGGALAALGVSTITGRKKGEPTPIP